MIPRRFMWVFDFFAIVLSFFLAYIFIPYFHELLRMAESEYRETALFFLPERWGGRMPPVSSLLWIFFVVALTGIVSLDIGGGRRSLVDQSYLQIIAVNFTGPLLGLSLVGLVLFAIKSPDVSRLFSFSFVIFSGLLLCSYRVVARGYFVRRREAGYYVRNIVLVGNISELKRLFDSFSKGSPTGAYRIIGYVPIKSSGDNIPELPCLGTVDQLGQLLVSLPIHEVLIVCPVLDGRWLNQIIQDCDYFQVGMHIVPEAVLKAEIRDLEIVKSPCILGIPGLTFAPHQVNSEAVFLKRIFDIVISASLLVLLLPLLVLIAIAIKITTPHLSIFYPWRVVGKNGVKFTGYKFTTVVADSDSIKKELLDRNEMTGPVFKMGNDPRVTPLGRLLRKYSLNELPQLWSVLTGHMSLVGPRPAFRHELEGYSLWHKRKLSVKPGITCLWQVRGRNKICEFDDWVKMDLEYIDNWSLLLDFKILLRTVWVVVVGTGS